MKTRDIEITVGSVLIILAIITAMGSISLGTFRVSVQQGGGTGAYLVTNFLFVIGALALGALGAFLFYRAGQDSARSRKIKKNPTEADELRNMN